MEKIILVHGAWHNASCWEGVIKALKEKGYEAEAVTLAGNGPEDDRKGITYEQALKPLVEKLEEQPEPAVLVGHSSAGHVIQMTAPKVADKISKIVFNNAWILPQGKSQFDMIPDQEMAMGIKQMALATPDHSIPLMEDFIRGALASGVSEEEQNRLISHLVPQPLALFDTPIQANAFAQLETPRVLLYCTEDLSLPPGAFVGMFQSLGEAPVVELQGSHEALFFQPEAYADALVQCIKTV
ncbi:alpha/beta fold hydrolase [Anoxynatronum sibiricum]|uniref:Alpha/beta fold hydrolase n=1 Tax=Anoxynatronum sibiricum TaxID=210623 RepID=A0ABU9VUE7_9CLOT